MENNLHLVKQSVFGRFEVTFFILGEDEVQYRGLMEGRLMTSTTMDRIQAMQTWNMLVERGYRPATA